MTPFDVESFEFVEAGPGLALLRLAGALPDEAELVAVADGGRVTLDPLPAPPSADGVRRVAYSARVALVRDPSVRFTLVVNDAVFELPSPVEHGTTPPAAAQEEPPEVVEEPRIERRTRRRPLLRALAAERDGRRRAEARATEAERALHEQLGGTIERAAELLSRIDSYEQGRVAFASEIDALRRTHAQLLTAANQELEATRGELLQATHQLDTLHEAHSIELSAARQQRDAAVERQRMLERELATVGERLESREALLERAREQAARAAREGAEMDAAAERLRDALLARVTEANSGGRRSTRRSQDLDAAREELRKGVERLEAVERQATMLRDAIRAQVPGSAPLDPLQEMLPLELPAH